MDNTKDFLHLLQSCRSLRINHKYQESKISPKRWPMMCDDTHNFEDSLPWNLNLNPENLALIPSKGSLLLSRRYCVEGRNLMPSFSSLTVVHISLDTRCWLLLGYRKSCQWIHTSLRVNVDLHMSIHQPYRFRYPSWSDHNFWIVSRQIRCESPNFSRARPAWRTVSCAWAERRELSLVSGVTTATIDVKLLHV